MLFKMAWRNLWRNKRRTLITTASIFLAVLLATFMRSLQEGSYSEMIKNVVSFYTGYVQIHKAGYWEEQKLDNSFENTAAIQTLLGADEDIKGVIPRLESALLISSGQKTHIAQIVGTDPKAEQELTGLADKVVAGRYLTDQDKGLLVAKGITEKLKVGVGDSLILLGQGYHGVTATEILPIIGIVKYNSPDLNKRILYLPLQEAQKMFAAPELLTSYVIDVKNPNSTNQIANTLKGELNADEYEVMPWEEMTPELVQMIESDRSGGILIMGVLYAIIGFGIFGTALMMINERKFEFGVLVAIGMKKGKLAIIMIYEMIILGVLGILSGILVSLPLVAYFQKYPIEFSGEMAKAYESFNIAPIIPTVLDGGIILSQAMVVLVMTLLVSIYPTIKILGLDPIQSMRK